MSFIYHYGALTFSLCYRVICYHPKQLSAGLTQSILLFSSFLYQEFRPALSPQRLLNMFPSRKNSSITKTTRWYVEESYVSEARLRRFNRSVPAFFFTITYSLVHTVNV